MRYVYSNLHSIISDRARAAFLKESMEMEKDDLNIHSRSRELSVPILREQEDEEEQIEIGEQEQEQEENELLTSPSPSPSSASYSFVKRYGEVLSVVLLVCVVVFVLGMVAYLAYASARMGNLEWTTFLSVTPIVMITIPIALQEIRMHLLNYYMPDLQKYVVRILWMVPIYSLQSWLALRVSPSIMAYIEPFRDWYEAYVLSSFVYYLIELCGGEVRLAQHLATKDASYGHHPKAAKLLFCGLLHDWPMGLPFLTNVKKGVLSFVVIKSLAALLIVVCKVCAIYTHPLVFYSIAILVSLALSYALHCLLKLYHATKDQLASWHPIYKFLCIKGVIFFTFWQGIAIVLFLQLTHIHSLGTFNAHRIKKEAQDILVVIEMLLFAIAHRYTFSYKEYKSYRHPSRYIHTNHTNNNINSNHHRHIHNINPKNATTSTIGTTPIQSNTTTSTSNQQYTSSSINNHNNHNNNATRLTQLSTPMNIFDAIKNSHWPKETLKDLKRFINLK